MSITGEIQSLYKDREQTQAIFPMTKVKAVSDDNGTGLDAILADLPTKNFVTAKIAEAQLGGGDGEIDLSGYATKDELNALDADDVGARPNTWMPTATEVGALPITGGAVGGHINMGDQFTVYGLIDPISPHDAMTKRYADVNYAPASHKHDSRYLRRYELNEINIDNTDGNWTVDIADYDHGTVPVNWVNVTQNTSGHFYTQIAKQCNNSTDATRTAAWMWYREKYIAGEWSAWSKIYHEGAKPTASEIGAAPAGYGLGEKAMFFNGPLINSLEGLDNAVATGFYAFSTGGRTTLNNVEFTGATIIVEAYIESRVQQTLKPFGSNTILRRHSFNGEWQPWECENPPMDFGKEYRTTERWNGKVVYAKAINCGAAVSGGMVSIDSGCQIVRADGMIDNNLIPHGKQGDTYHAYHNVAGNLVYLYCSDGFVNSPWYEQVWYTKE